MKNLEQKLISTRREVDDKLAEFNVKEQELNSRETEIVDKEKHLTKKINEKIEARLSIKEGQLISVYKKYGNVLERDYKNKEAKYMATFIMSLVYGIAVTTVQIIKSKVFQNDFIKTLMILSDIGKYITNLLRKSIVNVWRMQISGNTMGDFVVDSLICIIVIGLIVALILTGIKEIRHNIVSLIISIADKWMLGIVLLILECNLFLGEYAKALVPINLVMAIVFEIAISVIVRIVINKVGITAINELWNRVWPVAVGIVVLVLGMYFVWKVFY